jgi:hypothetical protein
MTKLLPSAYGMCFPGIDDGGYLMRAAPGEWPAVRVTHELDRAGAFRLVADDEDGGRLERSSSCGRVVVDRRARTARYFTAWPLEPDEFVRPFLDNAVTAFARWDGHEVFHAGAFTRHDGAWAVVGKSGEGKSTLLAALYEAGCEVMTDDLLVLDDERAFVGPRSIDLRDGSVEILGLADRVHRVRRGTVGRLRLPAMAAAVPLRGWVFLGWGSELGVERLTPVECLTRVTAMRMWANAPTDPRRLLRFGTLPAFELRREPHGRDLWPAVESLLAAIEPHGAAVESGARVPVVS